MGEAKRKRDELAKRCTLCRGTGRIPTNEMFANMPLTEPCKCPIGAERERRKWEDWAARHKSEGGEEKSDG